MHSIELNRVRGLSTSRSAITLGDWIYSGIAAMPLVLLPGACSVTLLCRVNGASSMRGCEFMSALSFRTSSEFTETT